MLVAAAVARPQLRPVAFGGDHVNCDAVQLCCGLSLVSAPPSWSPRRVSRQISRRDVLLGGAALGLGGALGAASLVTATQRAVAQTGAPMIPAGRVGATFDLFPFCPGTTYPQAVDTWNNTTGTSMRCWKVYYQPGEFPTSIDDRIRTIIDRGIQALISFKPAISLSATDRSKLASAVEMFHAAGLIAEVCLWQEVGPKDMTATQYHDVVAYYGPAVRQYYPLVFDAPGSQGPSEWSAYDPGRASLDGYAVDYYCSTFTNQSFRLETMAHVAGNLPLGIWEIGNTASAGFVPTAAQLTDYMNYLTSFLSRRAASGLPVGSVAWYNGPADALQDGANEIAGCNPSSVNPLVSTDIAAYRRLYGAVNGLP